MANSASIDLLAQLLALQGDFPEWWTVRDSWRVAEALKSQRGYCRICRHYQSRIVDQHGARHHRIGHAGDCARAAEAGAPPQKLGRSQHNSCDHGELRLPHLEPTSSLLSRVRDLTTATPEDHS